jgi:hypothetical protein
MKLSRWSVFAALALVVVVALIVDLNPGSILSSGYANAAKPGAQPTLPSTGRNGTGDQPFDYFPDHFVNQAKEPAEPLATF